MGRELDWDEATVANETARYIEWLERGAGSRERGAGAEGESPVPR
jgi:hypothetical protein